jgi:hypothetical protein
LPCRAVPCRAAPPHASKVDPDIIDYWSPCRAPQTPPKSVGSIHASNCIHPRTKRRIYNGARETRLRAVRPPPPPHHRHRRARSTRAMAREQEQPPMDAARRRLRAVSDHIRPPAPAAGCGGIYANPTAAGEYAAHGEPRPALLLSSVQVVFMPAVLVHIHAIVLAKSRTEVRSSEPLSCWLPHSCRSCLWWPAHRQRQRGFATESGTPGGQCLSLGLLLPDTWSSQYMLHCCFSLPTTEGTQSFSMQLYAH